MRILARAVVAAVLLAVFAFSPAQANRMMESATSFNVQAGLYGPGTFSVIDVGDFDTDLSFGLSGGLDYKLGEKITGGVIMAMNNFSGSDIDDSAMMIEIGFLIKAWINNEGSNILFRPGFGMSYGMLGGIGPLDSSNYMVINGVAELVFLTESNFNWLVTLGITGGPVGGNDDWDMSYGPGFILRGGVAF